jgi:hypothetical protein
MAGLLRLPGPGAEQDEGGRPRAVPGERLSTGARGLPPLAHHQQRRQGTDSDNAPPGSSGALQSCRRGPLPGLDHRCRGRRLWRLLPPPPPAQGAGRAVPLPLLLLVLMLPPSLVLQALQQGRRRTGKLRGVSCGRSGRRGRGDRRDGQRLARQRRRRRRRARSGRRRRRAMRNGARRPVGLPKLQRQRVDAGPPGAAPAARPGSPEVAACSRRESRGRSREWRWTSRGEAAVPRRSHRASGTAGQGLPITGIVARTCGAGRCCFAASVSVAAECARAREPPASPHQPALQHDVDTTVRCTGLLRCKCTGRGDEHCLAAWDACSLLRIA